MYSLGCVAYECLTAEVPYERDLEVAVLWAHVQESPPKPSATRPGLPAELDEVVAKAMAKEPDDRYMTAGEFAADIGRELGVGSGGRALLEPSTVHRRRRPRWLIAAGGLVSLAVLATVFVVATRSGPPPKVPPATPIGVSRIDVTSGRVTLSARDDKGGWDLVAAQGALWETGPDGLVKRDDTTGQVEKVLDVGGQANVVAAGFGAVWVTVVESPLESSLVRIDAATDEIVDRVDVSPSRPESGGVTWVAVDHGAVWVLNAEGTLWKIDPIADRIAERYDAITTTGSFLTAGGGFVWVSNALSNEILRVDPATGKTDTILIRSRADQLAFVGGTLWVMDPTGGTVTPIDASLLQPGAPIGVPKNPVLEVGGLGWLWIAADGLVSRINPVTGQVREIPVGFPASVVAPVERTGTVWVLRQPA